MVFALVHEHPEHPANGLDFFDRAGLQHDTIALQALLFAKGENGLGVAVLIDQPTAEPVTGVAALSEAQFDQSALAGEYFCRQLAAVFTGHGPLHRLDDRRGDAAVVLELLGAIADLDPRAPADIFVIGALVGVLEAAPSG